MRDNNNNYRQSTVKELNEQTVKDLYLGSKKK